MGGWVRCLQIELPDVWQKEDMSSVLSSCLPSGKLMKFCLLFEHLAVYLDCFQRESNFYVCDLSLLPSFPQLSADSKASIYMS